MKKEEDLFYFLQCSTVVSPGEKGWDMRVKEEKYALLKLMEYLDYLEKGDGSRRWFSIRPTDESATRWTGIISPPKRQDYEFTLILKNSYPFTPPAASIPALMKYTDRKLEDEVLGLRLCDMHMESNYWWNEHCGIALYMKREISYWVQAIIFDLDKKGWI